MVSLGNRCGTALKTAASTSRLSNRSTMVGIGTTPTRCKSKFSGVIVLNFFFEKYQWSHRLRLVSEKHGNIQGNIGYYAASLSSSGKHKIVGEQNPECL
jgi:hypothetical protein